MQILVVRHAPAEDLIESHSSDAARALTSKGRKLFREFVQRIIKPDHAPELILYSPLVRTTQTAEIMQEVMGIAKECVRVESLLSPGMSIAQLMKALHDLPERRIAIVGHNPDVSYCTSQLIGGGSIEFKKGSIASIDFVGSPQPGLGRLNWFISPKVLVDD